MNRCFLSLLACCAFAPASVRSEAPLLIAREEGAVTIRTPHGSEVLRYVLEKPSGSPLASESACYFHPFASPAGVELTEVGPDDHRHHRGIFLAWVEMHGGGVDADFWGWGEPAPTAGRRIVNRDVRDLSAEAGKASFTAHNEWRADDQVLIQEELRAEFKVRESMHILDLTYSLHPTRKLTLSRWAFSGFCVRTRKDGVAALDPGGTVKRPAPKHTAPDSDWPDQPWYAFALDAKGRKAGVAVMNHPMNPPTLWHNIAGIGMLNPCIVAPGEVKLTAGKPLVLRYRVVAFDGDPPTEKLNQFASEWAVVRHIYLSDPARKVIGN